MDAAKHRPKFLKRQDVRPRAKSCERAASPPRASTIEAVRSIAAESRRLGEVAAELHLGDVPDLVLEELLRSAERVIRSRLLLADGLAMDEVRAWVDGLRVVARGRVHVLPEGAELVP